MEDPFSIRQAEDRDREALAALLRLNYFGAENLAEEDEQIVQHRMAAQLDATHNGKGEGKLFLAIVQSEPVGLAYVERDARREGYVVGDLYTVKEHERKGIASALLKECEGFVRSRGEQDIHLNVMADNRPLVKFYEDREWLRQIFKKANTEECTDIDPLIPRFKTHLMRRRIDPGLS